MALSFPRPIPFDACFTDPGSFTLQYQQSRAITGGGSPNVANLGPAMWHGEYSTRVLTRADFEEWHAWLLSLRGGMRTFKGRPPRRKWPMAYPTGFAGLEVASAAFTGSGNLKAIAETRDSITVESLPVGFVLQLGDYLSLPVGTVQALHKVTEAGIAGAGGEVTVGIEPTARADAEADVAVLFGAPWCTMRLSADPSIQADPVKGGTISFEGLQVHI